MSPLHGLGCAVSLACLRAEALQHAQQSDPLPHPQAGYGSNDAAHAAKPNKASA